MRVLFIALSLILCSSVSAQKYFTKTGEISFYSEAPMEKIEATNHKATSVIDTETGQMQWSLLIKAFSFEKSLMEEHFNENYMESSKFPKGIFKGRIDNIKEIDFSAPGNYPATISGTLEIHGEKKEITSEGEFKVTESGVEGQSEFVISLADFGKKLEK